MKFPLEQQIPCTHTVYQQESAPIKDHLSGLFQNKTNTSWFVCPLGLFCAKVSRLPWSPYGEQLGVICGARCAGGLADVLISNQ